MTDIFENPMGLDGFEFVEFASPKPGVLEPMFEMLGFTEVARGPEFCGVSFTGGEGILFELDLLRITSWKQETS